MVWIFVFSPNSYVETLTARVVVLGGEALGQWLGQEDRTSWRGLASYKRDPRGVACPFHHMGLQQKHRTVYKGDPHLVPSLSATRSWTSQPLELWEINACCFQSTQFILFLFRQPEQTKAWGEFVINVLGYLKAQQKVMEALVFFLKCV